MMSRYKNKINSIVLFAVLSIITMGKLFAIQIVPEQIHISGTIVENANDEELDDLIVGYSKNDRFQGDYQGVTLRPKIDEKGNFEFSLPDLKKPYSVNIVLRKKNKDPLWTQMCYVEANDNIHINIFLKAKNKYAVFSGQGMEKYKLISELKDQLANGYRKELKTGSGVVSDSIELIKKIDELAIIVRKYTNKKKGLLGAAQMSPTTKTIIDYEFAKYLDDWRFRIQLFYHKNPTLRKLVYTNYLKYNDEFFEEPSELIVFTPQHLGSLASRILQELIMANNAEKVSLVAYYDKIKQSYSGIIRDRLIGNLVTSNIVYSYLENTTDEIKDSVYKDAENLVGILSVKDTLKNQRALLKKNKLIDASFTSLNENKFNLSSLKGKVILIDVWFNGCWGCAEFHKEFIKIYPKFKNNKDFVVVSVNVDKDKKRWMEGLKSNLYSSKEHLNVTTGSWFEHPFMKHYAIKSASYVMLADGNGNILPAPKSYEDLSVQIAKALEKVSKSK